MSSPNTAAKALADRLLQRDGHGGLDDFVITRRRAEQTWRAIARDLAEVSDGVLDYPPETLRRWYLSEPAAA